MITGHSFSIQIQRRNHPYSYFITNQHNYPIKNIVLDQTPAILANKRA